MNVIHYHCELWELTAAAWKALKVFKKKQTYPSPEMWNQLVGQKNKTYLIFSSFGVIHIFSHSFK